jgi:hypothetical protein
MKYWPTDTSKLWPDNIWHLDIETDTLTPWYFDNTWYLDTERWNFDTNDTDTDSKEETMPETIATTTLKASENVKLNPPKPFTGKQSDFILFMQDVYVYLKVNQLIYNDDKKKISFILSYLADGDAAV